MMNTRKWADDQIDDDFIKGMTFLEALGIYMIKKHDLNLLKKELECVDDNTFFHSALNNLISSRMMKIRPVYADNMFSKEIDFQKDLTILQNHFQS